MDISRVCEREIRCLWHYLWWFGLKCFDTKNGWNWISHSCALNVFPQSESSSFWYKKRKTYHTFNMLQTFLQIGYSCKTHNLFKYSLCEKRPIHFNTLVFLTSRTYQSWNRCDTMRLKLIPREKDTSLFFFFFFFFFFCYCFCSDKFCFSLNVFLFFVFLISKPFFTWIPQLIACIFFSFFFFFLFGAMFLY